MADNTKNDFKKAEAMGQVKSLPQAQAEVAAKETGESLDDTIDSIDAFRIAVGQAQMEGLEYVEVGEKLFRYLIKNQKTPYLTYGDPGIKVYLKGTREDLEAEESLNAEAYGELMAKRRSGEVRDKLGGKLR